MMGCPLGVDYYDASAGLVICIYICTYYDILIYSIHTICILYIYIIHFSRSTMRVSARFVTQGTLGNPTLRLAEARTNS